MAAAVVVRLSPRGVVGVVERLSPRGVAEALRRPPRIGPRGEVPLVGLRLTCLQRLTLSVVLAAMAARGVNPGSIDPWYFPSAAEYGDKLRSAGFEVRSIELIDRPTSLPTGIGGWIESVAHPFLRMVDPGDHDRLVAEVEDQVRPWLCDDQGEWHADYVRLRFFCSKP